MTWPRFTLRGMMVTVALVAANIAALRWLVPSDTNTPGLWVGVVVLPPVNALFIGLLRIGRQLARSGECGPFSVGFQALGWPATLTLAVACEAVLGMGNNGGWLRKYVDVAAVFLSSMVDASGSRAWLQSHHEVGFVVEALLLLLVLGGPLLILPLVGGLVFRKLGITLIRRPQPRNRSPHCALEAEA